MNAKEFVELIKKEKEEIVNRYVTPLENIQIKDTKFCKEQISHLFMEKFWWIFIYGNKAIRIIIFTASLGMAWYKI